MKSRAHLEAMPPYTPIEPFEILSARTGRSPSQIVKLDANENPYGLLPVVREALGNLDFPHIYPDPESRELRKKLASFTGVGEEYLMASAGADELIDLLMRVLLDPGDCILSCPPARSGGHRPRGQSAGSSRMTTYRERLSHHLSVGEKKRIAIATVLSMEPKILILEEPSAGVDPRARRTLINLLRELPISMLVSAHDMRLVAELFPRTIVMDDGRIVADGKTSHILEDEQLLNEHGLERP